MDFKAHYILLRDYLQSYLQQSGQSRSKSSAKEKLSRLPQEEFIKVSTDVYDEIRRRMYDYKEVPFLPVRADLLPKRNQARQKMATLSVLRFQELACEVLFEIEKRFAWLVDEYEKVTSTLGFNLQANQRSPVVDSPSRSNDNYRRDPPSSNSKPSREPQQRPYPTKTRVESSPIRQEGVLPDEVDRIRADYEFKISQLEQQLRDSHLEEAVIDLERQVADQKQMYASLKEKYDELSHQHESLQDDYAQQQKIADSLRAEASSLLVEVKTLTQKNKELEERQSRGVASESLKSPEMPKSNSNSRADPASSSNTNSRLDQYYDSINKLSQSARSDQPTAVLIAMKSVLIACKGVTQESESMETAGVLNESDKSRLRSGKEALSSCLSHLMALAKDHASGRMSVNALDAAVDRLTQALNDLANIMKRYDHKSPPVHSWATPPESPKRDLVTSAPQTSVMDIVQLKVLLEEETDDIAYTIQDLLQSMRSASCSGPELKRYIKEISDHIGIVVKESNQTFSKHGSSSLVSTASNLVNLLSRAKDTLQELGEDIVDQPGNKGLKQKIANTSYEIAKHVKELLGLLE